MWWWCFVLFTGTCFAFVWWTRKRDPVKCLLLGLDNSGKTSLTFVADEARIGPPPIPIGTSRRLPPLIQVAGRELILYDYPTWKGRDVVLEMYGPVVRAFVFVVDCADQNRLEEAVISFKALIQSPYKWPVLVFGNKIDLGNAISFDCLVEVLGLWNPKREAAVRAALFGVMLSHRRRGQNLFGRLPRDIALLIAKRVAASYREWDQRASLFIERPSVMKVNGRSVLVVMSSILTPQTYRDGFRELLRLIFNLPH